MKDLFDMTAGTSTGSILAAGLVYPNENYTAEKQPAFFADDLIKIYGTMGDQIFVKKQMTDGEAFFYCLLFVIFFTFCFYIIGHHCFDRPDVH